MVLNLTDAGVRIGKSRTTVRKMILRGTLKAKVDPDSRRLVVREEEIERYLDSFEDFVPPGKDAADEAADECDARENLADETVLSQPSHERP
ncbi:helix-turn-helix transcriptional regulator [Rhodopirellula sp. SWK7]|uniref:helix-turn-helix transcriptional regulator n=1 Tax=Rhodopirellula sp. SWK7 TaxID=595460 RepID=UPI000346EABA|nr:helix-turn-helix domain-containing protein [Rhodopirellula sp. SWK7]